jgi:predicted murein hydrolase (TIGR00659 family)
MKMSSLISLFCLILTLVAYRISIYLNHRFPNPLTTPVFTGTTIIIIVLLILGMNYDDYKPASDIITFFLGPATVALAVPLYRNYKVLVKNWLPALLGLSIGTLVAITLAIGLSNLFSYSHDITLAMATKGVTAPIALEIGAIFKGDPALIAAFVVATGTTGTIIGSWLLDKLRITDPMSRGIAMGTIAHGQGTAAALREGEVQGAMAGVAMGVTAIFTSFIAPIILPWLLP